MRKAFLIIMVLAGFTMHLSAQDFQSGDLLYTIIGMEPPQVRLDGHINGTTAQGTLDIPATVTHEGLTYAVIEIGEDAFFMSHDLIGDLVIPDGVTTIGNRAFDACSGFTGNLVLPSSVTRIGSFAFSECNFTGNLNIPNSVTDLGRNAFFECPSFTGDLVIPESLHKISYGAFMSCTSLTGNLFLPESIDTIEARALCHCGFTGTLNLPNNCRYIGPNAFEYCTGFTGELAIPEGTEIDYQAFIGSSGFTSLSLPNSMTTIKEGVFRYCSGLSGPLSLPTSLTTLGACAFEGCHGFTGPLVIPDGVTVIEGGCFCDCTGFTDTLALPNSLTHIYGGAFKNCSGFTQVTFPSSLIFIGGEPEFAGGGAFENCDGLEGSLELPDSLCFIGERAFMGCQHLTSISIGKSVDQIVTEAFSGCTNVNTLYFNATKCTEIINYYQTSFWLYNCPISTLVFGDEVLSIPANAFYYLSNALESIRSWAETPPIVKQNAFHGIDHDVLLKVPCGSAESYQSDPQWGVFNNIIEEYYELTVSSDDPDHGTCCILKQGDCDNAESIVQAIPAQNHVFTYWTNCGEVVSYDETYTFNLQTTTHLVAHFDYDGLLEECENGISFYPNPAKDIVYIEGAKVVEVSIFNTFGQLMKTIKNTNGIGLEDLSQGIYLMRIITADGSLHTTRLTVE